MQGGPRTIFGAKHIQLASESIYNYFLHKTSLGLKYDYGFPTISTDTVSSERELMAVASVSVILKESVMSAIETSCAATFVLHIAFLNHLSLPQRSLSPTKSTPQEREVFDNTIRWIIVVSRHFLNDESYQHTAAKLNPNIHDYVDGRLLWELQDQLESGGSHLGSLPELVFNDFARMVGAIEAISGCLLSLPDQIHFGGKKPSNSRRSFPRLASNSAGLAVMPFSNPTFDVYLSKIKLAIDSSAETTGVDKSNKRYHELTHWHNRRPLEQRFGQTRSTSWVKSTNKWHAGRARRSEQFLFSRMTKYAASLVGAKGKMLEPIVITNNPLHLQPTGKEPPRKGISGQSGKKEKTKSKAMSKKEIIRAENSKKITEKEDQSLQRMWQTLHREIHVMTDDEAKILRLDQFLNNIDSISSEKGSVVEGEARLYKVWMLQRIWAKLCRENAREDGYQIVAMIFDEARKILASKGLTKRANIILKNLFQALGIPMPPGRSSPNTLLDGKISFNPAWDGTSVADIQLQMTPIEFQLRHYGQYMDRDIDPKPDPRVSFIPDGWQRKVLDEIDRNNSVFVVAPTSAGKTFISFYAMEKVRELLQLYRCIFLLSI